MSLRRMLRVITALVLLMPLVPLVGAGTAAAQASPQADRHHARQLLFFNHLYAVLDRETADAIEDSAYLRRFANFQVRTTTGSNGEVWTGRYLLGRETYLELFGVGDLPGQDAQFGSSGLGLSTENAGDLTTVRQRLVDLGTTPIDFEQTRDFGDGVPIPWFDALFTTTAYDKFSPWAMEYRPEYFADPRSGTEPASHPGDVGRERYLNDDYRTHLMHDVTSVRLAVTQRDLDSTVPLLRAGGFSVHHLGSTVIATHGGTTIRLDPTTADAAGLRRVTMSLNHPVWYRHVEHLGRSTLTVGPGSYAVWSFPAP
ncbi:DUF5829 family protein [Labedaea rhizosphaerae]|uniref:Uncharacterized protein n=1 Tax=Labedaea rhizosphaerae TaxID=598644 RepID=A0A4R6SDI4_LABRH|nr:DUF5829 family protein [Labedaea rhizosphaerae]TDP97981.1 hypothetical protein EV186_103961 [Labedaea rhizosphaerae]